MEKVQKKAKKNLKSMKKQPLKVVYITNPIRFKTTASEFRALVQELTGRDANTDTAYAYSSTSLSAEDGGGDTAKAAAEGNAHVEVEQVVVTKSGRPWPSGAAVEHVDGYFPLPAGGEFDGGFDHVLKPSWLM